MKNILAAVLTLAVTVSAMAESVERKIIRIATDNTDLVFEVGPNKRI